MSEFQIIWVASRGTGYKSDIGLDRIKIDPKACRRPELCVEQNCAWAEWSSWSECKNGTRYRQRHTAQDSGCFGQTCAGGAGEVGRCCMPVACELSSWSSWSQCLHGKQTRTRQVLEKPSCNGTPCQDTEEMRDCSGIIWCDFETDCPLLQYGFWERRTSKMPDTLPESGDRETPSYLQLVIPVTENLNAAAQRLLYTSSTWVPGIQLRYTIE